MTKALTVIAKSKSELETVAEDLRHLTSAELREEMAAALTITAGGLVRAAAIVREMTERGDDISGYRSGIWSFLPAIGEGRLRAEVVVRYAGSLTLIKRLSDMPLSEQDRIMAAGSVAVVETIGGQLVEHQIPLLRLNRGQMKQAFSEAGIVAPDAQRKAIKATSSVRGGKATTPSPGQNGSIVRATFGVTLPEHDKLKEQAAERQISVSQLVYGALVEAGYLEAPKKTQRGVR